MSFPCFCPSCGFKSDYLRRVPGPGDCPRCEDRGVIVAMAAEANSEVALAGTANPLPPKCHCPQCGFNTYEDFQDQDCPRCREKGRVVAMVSEADREEDAELFGRSLPWNQDAPAGYAWKCPDCDSWATLGGNAAFHATTAKHAAPVLQITPPPAPPPPDPRDATIATLGAEVDRLKGWFHAIDGGDNPCRDEDVLRQWAYEAITLGRPCP